MTAVETLKPRHRFVEGDDVDRRTRPIRERDLVEREPAPPAPAFGGVVAARRIHEHAPDGVRREVERQTRLYEQDVSVERFVEGAEFTVAVVGNDPPRVLPVLQRATTPCSRRRCRLPTPVLWCRRQRKT